MIVRLYKELYRQAKEEAVYFIAFFEMVLIAGGFYMLYLVPRRTFYDGDQRLFSILNLVQHRTMPRISYSIVGPAFFTPFIFISKIYQAPYWRSGQYNKILLGVGMLCFYFLLRKHVNRSLLRKFFLILLVASMFGNNVSYFGGEVFTAVCVGVGLVAVVGGSSPVGWGAIILGVVNTPASIVGLICVVLRHIFKNKRLRYGLVIVIAAGLIMAEAWIRRGSPFNSGYSDQGFSTPFFFGLLSILFSFGKGLVFFASGLLLPVKSTLLKLQQSLKVDLYAVYILWIAFLVGLVLIYSSWWAWYGGWFWGPRFFLFASIPASFALAIRLHSPSTSLLVNLLTALVLCMSVWVGIDGLVFVQNTLEGVCVSHKYAQEYLCYYLPQFSVLWRPFTVPEHIYQDQINSIVFSIIVGIYLALPLLYTMGKQLITKARDVRKTHLPLKEWRL